MPEFKNTVKVLDTTTGQPLEISEDQFQDAMSTGRYAPEDKPIPALSPTGAPVNIDPYEAQKAFEQGYKYETTEQTIKRREAKEYNQPIKAGALGAASSASFGLSDHTLNAMGVTSPEELSKLQKYNPVASGIGNVAGIVAPAILTGGESLIAKGLSSGVKGAAKTGAAVESVVGKALTGAMGAGAEKSLAQRVILKSVPKAAGSAVEGSFYGLGQLMHEDALGEADFNAENVLASAGAGAMFGGVLGGGIGAVGELASPVASKVGEIFKNRAGKLISKYSDPERAAAELAGASKPQIFKLSERRPKILKDNLEVIQANEAMLKDSADIGQFYDRLEQKAENSLSDVSSKMDKAGQVMAEVPKEHPDLYKDIAQSYDNIIQDNARLEGNSAQIKQLTKTRDAYLKRAGNPEHISFSELRKDRAALDKLINFDKINPTLVTEAKKAERTVRESYIEKQLDDLRIKRPAEFGDLAEQYKAAKKEYAVAAEFGEGARKKSSDPNLLPSMYDLVLGGGVQHFLNGPVALATIAGKKFLESDMRRKLVVLSNIERANQHVNETIASSVKDFFNKTSKASKPASIKILLDSGFSINPDTGERPKNKEQGLDNIQKNIQKLNLSPEVNHDLLINRLSSMTKSAPKSAAKAHETFLRSIKFLDSKIPKKFETSPLRVHKPRKVSSLEMSKFERYLQAVDAPLTVFQDMKAGTLTREHVEALQAVYPSIYARLQESSMDYIAKQGQDLSYQKRLILGTLLNIPADASLEPQNIAGLQQNFAQEDEQNKESSVKPTSKSIREASFSESSQSANQAFLNRTATS